MSREWETVPEEKFDPRARHYRRYNKRQADLEDRKFRPENLTESDLRSGDTRRFLLDEGYGDLDEVLRVKNSFEGLID